MNRFMAAIRASGGPRQFVRVSDVDRTLVRAADFSAHDVQHRPGQRPSRLPSPARRAAYPCLKNPIGLKARPFAFVRLARLPCESNCRALGPRGDVVALDPAFQAGLGKRLDLRSEFSMAVVRQRVGSTPEFRFVGLCNRAGFLPDFRLSGYCLRLRHWANLLLHLASAERSCDFVFTGVLPCPGQRPSGLPSPARRAGYPCLKNPLGLKARPFDFGRLGRLAWESNCRAVGPCAGGVAIDPAFQAGLGKRLGRCPGFWMAVPRQRVESVFELLMVVPPQRVGSTLEFRLAELRQITRVFRTLAATFNVHRFTPADRAGHASQWMLKP